jgi:hypothetical protein
VNTSLTTMWLRGNGIDESNCVSIEALLARNTRFRSLFFFDARQMLLSVLCADECGVVWPDLLDDDDLDAVKARSVDQTLRAEFATVVEERRRRAATAAQLVAAEVDDKGGSPAVKRRRTNR